MGRYYNGDIDGKFWFGVQSSDDAEQFGAEAGDAGYIPYSVSELGPVKKRLYEIFEDLDMDPVFWDIDNEGKDNEAFDREYLEYVDKHGDGKTGLWASLLLGLKIYHCVKDEGMCCFDAEI